METYRGLALAPGDGESAPRAPQLQGWRRLLPLGVLGASVGLVALLALRGPGVALLRGGDAVVALHLKHANDSNATDKANKSNASKVSFPFRPYVSNSTGCLAMPAAAEDYNGIEDQRDFPVDMSLDQVRVFVIGDWGAPPDTNQTCFCDPAFDCDMQYQVANSMRARARRGERPQYILNAGDAFYLGGIEVDCNEPPSAAFGVAHDWFQRGWSGVYKELSMIPWISTLGNHDYGGFLFTSGWGQLIGYSFVNHNWIAPARWFNRRVKHKTFTAEYLVLDSNVMDANPPDDVETKDHNICSLHNRPDANCSANKGMTGIWTCNHWFVSTYLESKRWAMTTLSNSEADWKVLITHYPCGYDGSFFGGLHTHYGLDLLITGHRHQQELWWPGTTSKYVRHWMDVNQLGSLACVVTGGGGGILSETFDYVDYGHDITLYGYFDLLITKYQMSIALVDWASRVAGNYTIYPQSRRFEDDW